MSAKINNFKIGLFTLIGVALLVTGLLVFGAWSNFMKTSLFETYVDGDVSGLSVGSAVELRGVRVGKVTRIGFSWNEYQDSTPGYVVVVFEVNDNVGTVPPGQARNEQVQAAVNRGLRARPKMQGVTGTSIVSLEFLDPAQNPPLKLPWTPRHTYIPAAPGQLREMLASVEKFLRNVECLDFGALNQLLQRDLKSAGQVLDRVGQVDFGGLSTNANSLVTELRSSNTDLKTFLGDTRETLRRMKLDKLTQDVDGLVGQLRETVGKVEPGLANFDFEALNQTLANARRAMGDMDDVLLELKQYPSGFIFGKPPPAFKAVQTPAK
jgi:ABC-type transporter Mla subunit MlaD